MAVLFKYFVIAICGGLYLCLVFAWHAQTRTREMYVPQRHQTRCTIAPHGRFLQMFPHQTSALFAILFVYLQLNKKKAKAIFRFFFSSMEASFQFCLDVVTVYR